MCLQTGQTLLSHVLFHLVTAFIHRSVHFPYVRFLISLSLSSDADVDFKGFIAMLIVRFLLANKDVVPVGWAARLLIQCGVQFAEIWDVFNEMYESQVKQYIVFHGRSESHSIFIRCPPSTTRPTFKQYHPKLLSSLLIG